MCGYTTTNGKNRHLEVAPWCSPLMYLNFFGGSSFDHCLLINRMTSRLLNFQTRYELLLKFYPYTPFIHALSEKVFGCTTFFHISTHNRSKLDLKALKCVFIGYSSYKKGTSAIHLLIENSITPWMLHSVRNNPYHKTNIRWETKKWISTLGHWHTRINLCSYYWTCWTIIKNSHKTN